MVFGLPKKERKVPDLSRYDYYYRNKELEEQEQEYLYDYGDENGYEENQRYSYSSNVRRNNNVNAQYRSYSVTSNDKKYYSSSHSGAHSNANTKTRSLVSPQKSRNSRRTSQSNHNGRTYSIKSQNSHDAGKRLNSVSSVNSKKIASNNNAVNNSSRSNSITVKTTEVKDPHGKTQSITRKTIKRLNGYEYIETTTTTTTTVKKKSSPSKKSQRSGSNSKQSQKQRSASRDTEINKHFQEFSNDYVEEDDYDHLAEQGYIDGDDEVEPHRAPEHQKYLHDAPNYNSTEDEDEFGNNTIEEEDEEQVEQELRANNLEIRNSARKTSNHGYRALLMSTETQPKTDAALVPLDDTSSISKFSEAREDIVSNNSEIKTPIKTNSRKPDSSKLRNNKKMIRGKSTQSNIHNNSAPNSNYNKLKVKVSDPSLRKSSIASPKEPKKHLTEEQMYAVAFEIARKKVYQNSQPPPTVNNGQYLSPHVPAIMEETRKTSRMSNRMSIGQHHPNMNQDDHRTNYSGQNPDVYSQHSRRGSYASTIPTSIGSNKKITDVHILHNTEGNTPLKKKALTDEEMYAKALQIAQKKYNDSHVPTNMVLTPKPPVLEHPQVNNSDHSISSVVPDIPPLTSRPSANQKEIEEIQQVQVTQDIPEVQHDDVNPQEFVPEEATTLSPKFSRIRKLSSVSLGKKPKNNESLPKENISTDSESPSKSKLKNVFSKVVQFSQENSGYQPSKKDRQTSGEQQINEIQSEHNTDFVSSAFANADTNDSSIPTGISTSKVGDKGVTQETVQTAETVVSENIEFVKPEALVDGDLTTGKSPRRRTDTMESISVRSFKDSLRGPQRSRINSNISGNGSKTTQLSFNEIARQHSATSNVPMEINPIKNTSANSDSNSKSSKKHNKKLGFFGKIFKH